MDRYRADQMLEHYQKNWPEAFSSISTFGVYLLRIRELSLSNVMPVVDAVGLSSPEFDTLASLRRSPPPHQLTPNDLQRSMVITSGGLTKILYQLEARGLVTRSVNEADKRSKFVNLTAKGKNLIEETLNAVHEREEKWLRAAFKDHELDELIALMGKALRVLEK